MNDITILPDTDGTRRVRAHYGGRTTAWPEGKPVMLQEIEAEFADLPGRGDGPWLVSAVARADDIPGLYADALDQARKLYGPDAELVIEHAGMIAKTTMPGGMYRCDITVRCVNGKELASPSAREDDEAGRK